MMDDQSTLRISGGMDVVGSDGEKLGSVDRMEGDYVVASKGFFFPTDYYIPVDAISNVDEERVYLNVTKDIALDQGWDTMPTETSTSTTYVDDVATAAPLTSPMGGSVGRVPDAGVTNTSTTAGEVADQSLEHRSDHTSTHADDSESIRVPLSEEELTATKRTVDRGAVQIEKDVVAEEQTLEVPVTEERVNVTRRTVDRDASPGDATFEGGTIDVPVRGEEVDVQKQARVREELEISKDTVAETERVSGTVRREEGRVSGATDEVTGTDATTNRRNRSS